jgi:hypothetical protein
MKKSLTNGWVTTKLDKTDMYIIKRTEKDGGGYVAKEGSAHSYTHDMSKARTFKTLEEAERNRCPDNEIILKRNGY